MTDMSKNQKESYNSAVIQYSSIKPQDQGNNRISGSNKKTTKKSSKTSRKVGSTTDSQ